VRLLQLDTDDNFVLDLKAREFLGSSRSRPASAAADMGGIVSIVYERTQQVLAAATAGGQVWLFRRWLTGTMAGTTAAADPASQWQPSHSFWVSVRCTASAQATKQVQAGSSVSGTVTAALGWLTPRCLPLCCAGAGLNPQQVGSAPERLSWGPTAQVLAASCADGLHLCQKSPLHHKLSDGYAAVQVRGTVRSTAHKQKHIAEVRLSLTPCTSQLALHQHCCCGD
jgi:hypothetical protein